MRVAIAGAGAVGRSIARELIDNGHEVLLIDKDSDSIKPERVPNAEWLLADSCELSLAGGGRLQHCDVVIAATGDDKANLVTSLLAKTEFGVPRTVGRVNHPNNEWLFTEAWGVDVNVSTPRIMSALVEEAVTVGDLVRLFTFRQGNANLVEMTLPDDSPFVGKPTGLDPVARERRAGDDPARRPGLHPRRGAAHRGRRRAAVRGLGRRRGGARADARALAATAAEPRRSARAQARFLGHRGRVAREQPHHQRPAAPAAAASPWRAWRRPARRPPRPRRSTPLAGQVDRGLDHHPEHAGHDQHPGEQACTASRSACRGATRSGRR